MFGGFFIDLTLHELVITFFVLLFILLGLLWVASKVWPFVLMGGMAWLFIHIKHKHDQA